MALCKRCMTSNHPRIDPQTTKRLPGKKCLHEQSHCFRHPGLSPVDGTGIFLAPNDAITSISLGIISQLSGVLSKVLTVGMYTVVFSAVALYPRLEGWTTWYGLPLAPRWILLTYYAAQMLIVHHARPALRSPANR